MGFERTISVDLINDGNEGCDGDVYLRQLKANLVNTTYFLYVFRMICFSVNSSNRWDCSMQKNFNNWFYDNRLLSGILLYLLNRVWDSVWFGANKCDLIKLATNKKIITGNVYAFFYEIVKIDWCKENFVIVE